MEFRLFYRGPLKPNGNVEQKHNIRGCFHKQLLELWQQRPLCDHREFLEFPAKPGGISIVRTVGQYRFASLVTKCLDTTAALDILFLRPEAPGSLITAGGDIDNRIKTLLDAMRMPQEPKEIPQGAQPPAEGVFFCVLENDSLVTSLSVTTDRWLVPSVSVDKSDVILVIRVTVKPTKVVIATLGLF
jgi:hypothetical protein